ncbi:hypothetical protein [Methylococcus geothermalis]|uniref:Uncharacterized protein n=1 Tax=Methylococcus geothermalis TaxID=2681310 RepID=A0A858QAP6_9GAMM|nr:hypothetical protein [Methylococcus geothermalis]QJD30910.1 hypothetical protein GNH96_13695 [Methylococcus geothermalis]
MEETSERTVRALIGMNKAQFAKLYPIFEEAYAEIQQERVREPLNKPDLAGKNTSR